MPSTEWHVHWPIAVRYSVDSCFVVGPMVITLYGVSGYFDGTDVYPLMGHFNGITQNKIAMKKWWSTQAYVSRPFWNKADGSCGPLSELYVINGLNPGPMIGHMLTDRNYERWSPDARSYGLQVNRLQKEGQRRNTKLFSLPILLTCEV